MARSGVDWAATMDSFNSLSGRNRVLRHLAASAERQPGRKGADSFRDETLMDLLVIVEGAGEDLNEEALDAFVRADTGGKAWRWPSAAERASGRRAGWIIAVHVLGRVLARLERAALDALEPIQADILFWRQRVGDAFQEFVERGPWGWVSGLVLEAPATPEQHVQALEAMQEPLLTTLGACARARTVFLANLTLAAQDFATAIAPKGPGGGTVDSVPEGRPGAATAAAAAASKPDGGRLPHSDPASSRAGAASQSTPPAGLARVIRHSESRPSNSSSSSVEASPLFRISGKRTYLFRRACGALVAALRAVLGSALMQPDCARATRALLHEASRAGARGSTVRTPQGAIAFALQAQRALQGFMNQARAWAGQHRRRWGPLRNWHRISVAAVAVGGAAWYLWSRRERFADLVQSVVQSVREFGDEHLLGPIQDMVGELLRGQKRRIADPLALPASKEGLRVMLEEYYAKNLDVLRDSVEVSPSQGSDRGRVSDEQLRALARQLAAANDISPIEARLAKDVGSPFRSTLQGQLPQLLLIQVAFMKKGAFGGCH